MNWYAFLNTKKKSLQKYYQLIKYKFCFQFIKYKSSLTYFLILFYRHANDNLSLKDRELKSMRRQLDSTSEDLSESSRSKDIALRENRRLQDDLSVMTRENQKLNSELQETLEEREQLKHQVQDYIMEVKRIEDVLARKVSLKAFVLWTLFVTVLILASKK